MQQKKNKQSKVKELMTPNPEIVSPEATLKEAAQKMEQIDCGVLPVGTPQNLEGIITDRDIVLRAVAQGKDPSVEFVRDHMTPGVCYCDENDTAERAAELMRENQVNRLIVRDASGQMCGILTFGRIIRKDDSIGEIANVIECAVGQKAA